MGGSGSEELIYEDEDINDYYDHETCQKKLVLKGRVGLRFKTIASVEDVDQGSAPLGKSVHNRSVGVRRSSSSAKAPGNSGLKRNASLGMVQQINNTA
ncbi:hypothetical protein FLAG1_02018 [Fusarium langsethiae]|uniref:Uncharacterized protein n=1 Tax=Fusarium langsethiae TaxID=179993 RepID=A0A0M9F2Y3_FUSLA|nr:hypothetical protein FLAG1_02018 [Fusarium langsethiae]GKU01088.1 unnamed protein product [Fusarium langsethiae]GKU11814.1 unnamed protein product [Fusarium langsethiae]